MIIFLTGFMGSGKTTMGSQLAEQLNYPFIDLDKFIEERLHISVSKIFEHYGEYFFRKTETEFLHEMASWKNLIVATGGGTPCHDKNMEWMNANGKTVYLQATTDELYKRLQTPEEKIQRPKIKDLKAAELKKYITDNLKKREFYYNQSAIIYEEKNDLKKDVKALLELVG